MTRTASTNRLHVAAALFGLVAAPVLMSGCKQKVLCPALEGCGGAVPGGDWVLDPAHTSCSEDLWIPPIDPRLKSADLPVARTPPPEPAHFDWCQLIGTGQGADIVKNKPPSLYVESPPVGGATLHVDATAMTYVLSTRRTGSYVLDIPSYCMRAFGAVDNADGNVCLRVEKSFATGLAAKYSNFKCRLDENDTPVMPGQEGCLCTFDLVDVQVSSGRFLPPFDGTIVHLPGNDFPEAVSYCNSGDRLQLTGADGEYLFDRFGLRTMDMAKINVNCADHMKGPAEDGVDCGIACPISCSQIVCNDMVQGPGEDGVDCGPNCPAAPVCPPAI